MAVWLLERPVTKALRDYLVLARPRSVLPHLITAAAAMFLALNGPPPASILLFTLLGGGLTAAAANIFNSYFDRDLDGLMPRTRLRPLPAGRLAPREALALGISLGMIGLLILGCFSGGKAAALAAGALAYYALGYTTWLKRRTCWGAVAGSGAGAFPPLIGWVAVTGRLGPIPLLLFGIIALWTLPHFWSLAFYRRHEYASAGLKVLPSHVTNWTLGATGLLVAGTLLLVPAAGMGRLYLGAAALLGMAFFTLAARLHGSEVPERARQLHFFSIVYITALFIAMIADRVIL